MARTKEQQRLYMREYRARKRQERDDPAAAEAPLPPPAGATTDAPATQPGRHAAAVDKMLRDSGLDRSLEEGPLVELVRDLASELDAGSTARTRQQYLSALRDVRKVIAAAPGVSGAGGSAADEPDEPAIEEPAVPAVDPEVADFASFRRAKGGAAQG